MYSTLVAWMKTYTDARSMSTWYDESSQPRWFMRDKVVVRVVKNDDDDAIPAGMAKSVYPFSFEFFTSKIGVTTSTLTTAFDNLLRDMTKLYIFDNPITTGTTTITTFKITSLNHIAFEDADIFGHRLEIDLEYWEYL